MNKPRAIAELVAVVLYGIALLFVINVILAWTTEKLDAYGNITYSVPWQIRLPAAAITLPFVVYRLFYHARELNRARPYRFSLRALLIAMTLFALVLFLIGLVARLISELPTIPG